MGKSIYVVDVSLYFGMFTKLADDEFYIKDIYYESDILTFVRKWGNFSFDICVAGNRTIWILWYCMVLFWKIKV